MKKGLQRALTPYGRQIKLALIERNMTANQLAEAIEAPPQRVNDILYGVMPGNKYHAQIEKALGVKPPAAKLNKCKGATP